MAGQARPRSPAGAVPPARRSDGSTLTPTIAGLRSLRSAVSRPTSGGTQFRHDGGQAEQLRLADDRAMHRGDVATLTPLGDKYLALAEDAAGVQHQEPQQSELEWASARSRVLSRRTSWPSSSSSRPATRSRVAGAGPAGAPQHRPDPFQHLVQAERLGDVVVSAQGQAGRHALARHRRGRSGR